MVSLKSFVRLSAVDRAAGSDQRHQSLQPREKGYARFVPSRPRDPDRLRAVDIARTAGISVQQVRNYVDLGLLPPVTRTASGYRVFTAVHAAAVVTVRRMALGHGWARTHTIMRAVHAGDLDAALAALDAGHAELDHERAEIARVLAAFDTLATDAGDGTADAGDTPAPLAPGPRTASHGAPGTTRGTGRRAGPRTALRVGEVARATGVRTSALRLWEQYGLLRPAREKATGYRTYDAAELRNARVVALLRRGGYPIPIIRAVLAELRTTGSPARVRAELAKRERDLTTRSRHRLAASAALHAYLEHRAAAP